MFWKGVFYFIFAGEKCTFATEGLDENVGFIHRRFYTDIEGSKTIGLGYGPFRGINLQVRRHFQSIKMQMLLPLVPSVLCDQFQNIR